MKEIKEALDKYKLLSDIVSDLAFFKDVDWEQDEHLEALKNGYQALKSLESLKSRCITFYLTEKELDKIAEFRRKQNVKWAAKHPSPDNPGEPYFGAIGGDLTFQFTPTSLGLITKVIHASGAELDITDYDNW